MDSTTQRLYFGARRTCLEMLTDRGYEILPSLMTVKLQEFSDEHLEIVNITDKDDNQVFIKMFREAIKPADIKAAFKKFLQEADIEIEKDLELLSAEDKLHLIIVYDPLLGTASTPYKFETDHVGHPFLEVFDVHKLYINPTKHVYQPKWRLMKEKEISDLLQRYEAKMTQTTRVILGSVCIDDPMNRYYFGKPPSKDRRGDVYEIIRDGTSIFYRKVVNKKMNIKTEKSK